MLGIDVRAAVPADVHTKEEKKRKGDAGRRDYGSLSYRQGPPLTEGVHTI
jgi:hypothetical protein